MMAKIVKGNSFRNCVNYVTRAAKDLPDGSPCGEWRILAMEGLPTYDGREGIIRNFEDNHALNSGIKNPVGHISLNFHADDSGKIDDEKMIEIADKYLRRMGYSDTPFMVVRHLDKDYPHCHIVVSRINNQGRLISDKKDFSRNRRVCMDLTKEYGLHISESKEHTNVNRLRGSEKIRYEIFNAVNSAWNDSGVASFGQFEARLKEAGVGIGYKYRSGTDEIQGLWYTRKGKRFPASKIDRRFSYGNILKHLKAVKPLHPQSKWLYADGSIVPIFSFRGVRLTKEQTTDYTNGKAVRIDGCKGEYPTIYLRFEQKDMKPVTYSANPDEIERANAYGYSPSFPMYHGIQSATVVDSISAASGSRDDEDFKKFLERHPGMSITEAIREFRAKKRGKHMNGGFHM